MRRFGIAVVLALIGCCAPAQAADPGRWAFTGTSSMPLYYYQGVTADPAGRLYFDGIDFGLYRTDAQLREQARNDDVIPPAVTATEGYNHIGDISWDAAERGRIILPLECYYPPVGNTCGTGSFGVADPETLRWRYYVKLDPAFIAKAMWAELSPDGTTIWTSSGSDLLGYRAKDVKPSHAAPAGPRIKPSMRLRGAVPPPASRARPSMAAGCSSPVRTATASRSGRSTSPPARGSWRSSARSSGSPRASPSSTRSAASCTGRCSRTTSRACPPTRR